MVRMPWTKGLLGVFDFKSFIKEKSCSAKVNDLWGKEWDIFQDNIQVIFTKSQLKMYAYFDSWDDYKERFKKYKCSAGKCNVEENYFKKSHLNYQMLQSFIDYKDSELKKMCADSVSFINGICSDDNLRITFATGARDKLVISKNLVDFLFCSTNQSFTSCFKLQNDTMNKLKKFCETDGYYITSAL